MTTIPKPEDLVDRTLDTNGDGTGEWNAIGDYSLAPQMFSYRCGPRGVFVRKVQVTIQAGNDIRPELYGSLPALTNGIKWIVTDPAGGIAHAFANVNTIKNNAMWGVLTGGLTFWEFGGGVDEFMQATWGTGDRDMFYLPPKYSIDMELSDDFTGLTNHVFFIQGRCSEGAR